MDQPDQRPHLLYLVHRIPYPPRKGDKVRSYHQLKYLAERYRIHLGTFVDDPADLEYIDNVRSMCESLCVRRLHPRLARVLSARALLSGKALSVDYFASPFLMRWVRDTVNTHGIRRVLVFSSSMAQYATPLLRADMRAVVDFVDVDSEKWRNYAELNRGLMRWIYAREGRELLAYERSLAKRYDASVFVSEEEASLFRRLAPESAERVLQIRNGVDATYFDPHTAHDNPYAGPDAAKAPTLVFTGAMDYRANVDAVLWFVGKVWPHVRRVMPDARFYVVGANPVAQLRALHDIDGVQVTGTVPDVRPYLAHATLAVAPLRVARGIQNKVLEAMAMELPVVATSAAVEGIISGHGLDGWIADEPEQMAQQLLSLLRRSDVGELGAAGRQFVLQHYDWSASISALADLLEPNGQ
jgi:sugar transferase (PEP-CTERM/EpsH1 system associated)